MNSNSILSVFTRILNISRPFKIIIMVSIDILFLILVAYLSLSLRLGKLYLFGFLNPFEMYTLFSCIPFIALPIFFKFGLYRLTIRYIGFKSIWTLMKAVSLYALVSGVLVYFFQLHNFPRSVILINWFLSIFAIVGSRMLFRWIVTSLESNKNLNKKNVLIYGAGPAGRQLLNALYHSDEYQPIALIDDSIEIQQQLINGLEVFAPRLISKLIKDNDISQVLLAMPKLSRSERSAIIKLVSNFSVMVQSLPSLSQLAEGVVKIEDLQEVNIKDLLGRDAVDHNINLLQANITDKIVLVTGAGGSIGSELCRQIVKLKPKKIILFELSESALYQIQQEILQFKDLDFETVAILGSVRDKLRVQRIFKHFGVQTVYHAAAYKHVPLVEFNQSEGVLNNTIGTMIAAEAAITTNVEMFVLISTDKAVRPTNTMGASKRVSELILQAFAKQSHNTCFTMVRFGNVLDSSGSVIPTFKKQIKAGGPVTVTDRKIERYFMTIPEAVELVIQAGAMAKGGEVFVLDMGKPILIYDLAVKMIQLSGLKVLDKNNPRGDIEIKFIGLRPGEKLFEELLSGDNIVQTENKLIMSAREEMIDWDELSPILVQIQDAALNSNQGKIRELLIELVPDFKPQSKVIDLLHNK